MATKILSGDKEVLDSGSFEIFDDKQPVTMVIEKDGEAIEFVLDFLTNPEVKGTIIHVTNGPSPNKLLIHFYNFNDNFGIGSAEPIKLGIFLGRELFVHFWHENNLLNKEKPIRVVTYTLYLGGQNVPRS